MNRRDRTVRGLLHPGSGPVALGAAAVGTGLAWGGTFLPALARPEVLALGALLAGVAVAGVVRLAHKIGLLAVGGVAGVALGAGVAELTRIGHAAAEPAPGEPRESETPGS